MIRRKIPLSEFLSTVRIPVFAGIIYFLCFQPHSRLIDAVIQENAGSNPSAHRVITLHNATKRTFSYLIEPLFHDTLPEKGFIEPGNIARFTKGNHLEIKLLPEETGLMYRLYPGEDYCVQDLGVEGQRIFKNTGRTSKALCLAPFVPSPMKAVHRMLETAGVNHDSVVYDLGCGDGRIVIAAARKYGARGVGIDIDPDLIRTARLEARKAGVASLVEFHSQDIFDADISDATVVYLYLYTDSNRLLRPFLETGLKSGALVACLNFMIPGWRKRLVSSTEVSTEDDVVDDVIYFYQR